MVGRLTNARGFTVIELMVVIVILTVLALAVVPGVRGISESYSLTAGADQVASFFNLARQTAIARNQPVEIRLYRLPTTSNADPGQFRMVAALIPGSSGSGNEEWIDRMRPLPNGVIFDDGTFNGEFSSVISNATSAANAIPRLLSGASTGVPPLIQNRPYVAFNIRPDGSTNLDPASQWTLSLRIEQDRSGSAARPSNNFVTFIIDPVLGRLKVFRP